jgi:hypothetical protein
MAKSLKLPKRIAGVKLPRKARKTANKAIKVGANPVVRELAVAAIGAAGGKAMGERKAPNAEAGSSGGRAGAELDFAKVGEAFRAAAIDGLRRFLEGFEEGLRELSERSEAAGETAKRKAAKAFSGGTDSSDESENAPGKG